MIKLIKIKNEGNKIIYSFETTNVNEKGTISLDAETKEMKLLHVPEELKFIAVKAYSALRYMLKNAGISDEYTYAWY